MSFAAAPAWFADNLVQISGGTLLVLAALVMRLAQKVALRLTLLAVLAVITLFIYVNRAPLQACVRTCECSLAGRQVTVPTCNQPL